MSTMDRSERVREVVAGLAAELNSGRDLSQLGPNSHLEWDLGIGSLERLELTRRLEAAMDMRLPAQSIFLSRTLRDLLEAVENPGAVDEAESGPAPTAVAPDAVPPPPQTAQSLLEALVYQAQHQKERVLFYFEKEGQPERAMSAVELLTEVGQMAGSLSELGIKPGDRVGIMLPTGVAFVTCFFAVQWLGAVPVPLYPPFRPDQAEDYVMRQAAILDNAGAAVLITFARAWTMTQLVRLHARSLKEVVSAESLVSGTPPPRHPVVATELGLIQYTSGSTGSPKGVALTHANLLHNLRAYGKALAVGPSDVCVSWLPLYHDMGLIGSMLGSIYHGIPLVLMGPQDFLARPSRWLRAISRFRGTISPAPNFAYEVCARRIPDEELTGLDLSSWRVALNGAEPVRLETLERFRDRYAPYGFHQEAIFPAYGLAEAALAVAFSPRWRGPKVDRVSQTALETDRVARPPSQGEAELTLVSSGCPLDGTELSVRGPGGEDLAERREGRLYFRSGSSLQSYYNQPEATRAIKSPDGWVDTGDLAYLAEGELYITGRHKDIIVKAGRNLHPQDVEELTADVEGVRRGCVAAFGVNDARSGTELLVVVFETRQKGPECGQLVEQVQRRLSQRLGLPPDHVVAVGPGLLPKTPSGKIRREECRRRFQAGTLNKRPALAKQVARLMRGQLLKMPLQAARGVWCTGCLFTVVGGPALGLSLLRPELARRLMHSASKTFLTLSRLPLTVEGQAYAGPCLVVSNHCSLLDPILVMAAWPRPLKFLIAPWVFDHPLLAKGLRKLGHLRATRGDSAGATQVTEEMGQVLNHGDCMAVFPEGGLESTAGLRPFSLGVFQVAAATGVPIIPLAIVGSRKAMPWPSLVPLAGPLRVHLGPPLRAGGTEFGHAVELAQTVREWIGARCGEPLVDQRLRRED